MGSAVGVTVFNPATKLIVRIDVVVDTTAGARMVATRNACQAKARAFQWPLFAIPSFVQRDGRERWLVFEMQSGHAMLKRDWPTRDAAEMWMQHNGDRHGDQG